VSAQHGSLAAAERLAGRLGRKSALGGDADPGAPADAGGRAVHQRGAVAWAGVRQALVTPVRFHTPASRLGDRRRRERARRAAVRSRVGAPHRPTVPSGGRAGVCKGTYILDSLS
jgi:hypothetical protein